MFGGYKKIFFLSISILCSNSVLAQFIDDIDLFPDENMPVVQKAKEQPVSLVVKSEEKKEVLAPTIDIPKMDTSEPNIGRKAIALEKIVLTPDPLPEISVDLSDKKPVQVISDQPQQPINTRQEGIYIPPADKTVVSPASPSGFANFHDVRQFDLEGFYLGMTPNAVLQMARQKYYQISKIKKAIPLFQTTYYETICRKSGIYVPDMIRACIRGYAKNNKQDYVEEIVLTKKPTRESFSFKFTSPATDNEAYQIIYQNRGDNSLNFTRPNLAKKLNRKEAFFNAVFNMYGYPDDSKELVWGAKEDAYMQVSMMGSAYDATIKLVDTKLSNEDYFEATDWKADQELTEHFGFDE